MLFCQIASTLCLALYAEKKCPPLRLKRADLRLDGSLGILLLSYAWAAALQQALFFCIKNIFVILRNKNNFIFYTLFYSF